MHAHDNRMKLMSWLRYQKASSIRGWHNQWLKIDYLVVDSTLYLVDRLLLLASWAGIISAPRTGA